jgi:hypothetical protein
LPGVHVVPSDYLLARLTRSSLHAEELLDVALRLASPGHGLRYRQIEIPELVGATLEQAETRIVEARLIGVLYEGRGGASCLDVASERVVAVGDRLLVAAWGEARAREAAPLQIVQTPVQVLPGGSPLRALVLGWNATTPDLLGELSRMSRVHFEVEVFALLDREAREAELAALPALGPMLTLRHTLGDPASVRDLAHIDVAAYDRFLIAADRTQRDAEAADDMTMVAALSLAQRRDRMRPGAYVVAELLDPASVGGLTSVRHVVTPHVVANALAALARNPELVGLVRHHLNDPRLYALQVVEVPVEAAKDEAILARGLRAQHLAFFQVLKEQPDPTKRRVLVVEGTGPGSV